MFVERPDTKIFWQATGNGTDLFLCPPRQPVIYSRLWKNQIPYLARHGRAETGAVKRADRCKTAAACDQPVPERRHSAAKRRQRAASGNDSLRSQLRFHQLRAGRPRSRPVAKLLN